MPFYDYKCKDCGHTWDEQQTVDARNVPRYNPCPDCGSSGNIIIHIGKANLANPLNLDMSPLVRPQPQFEERLREIKKNYSKAGVDIQSKFGN